MKMFAAALFASASLALAAAGSSWADPPGQSYAAQYGEGEYVIIVRGERNMSRRDVATAAMARAARQALNDGHRWFIVSTATTTRVDLNSAPTLASLAGASSQTGSQVADALSTGGVQGQQAGGHGATAGADPGAVGVGTGVDPRLLERRPPRMVYQTILLIRAGSGSEVTVDDANAEIQIFDAAAIAEQLGG